MPEDTGQILDTASGSEVDGIDPSALKGFRVERRGACLLVNRRVYVSIESIRQASDQRRYLMDTVYWFDGYGMNPRESGALRP